MVLKTGEEYIESVRRLSPRIYINGEKVDSILGNPILETMVKANAKVYDLAHQEPYREIMTAHSDYIGELVNRTVHICKSVEDLKKKNEMARLVASLLGTCNYRCTGCDALNTLASVTYEMDAKLGTSYHKRFLEFLKRVQTEDLACTGGLTDVKGDRSKRPKEQDPDVCLRVVDKRDDGIIVRGAKVCQSGAAVAHENIILPGMTFRKGEEEYAVAFAVPNGAKGLTYICQYTPFEAERMHAEDLGELGNPLYGVRETFLMVFDDVFIPWDRVFMCGEVEFTALMWSRFARIHRMVCGGACKAGFGDLMIGAAQAIAEYLGIAEASHIREKIVEMVRLNETVSACSIASAVKGCEEPPGSGVYLPDGLFSNISKLNCAENFWKLMALLGDIAGGLTVTMPSERELKNPETSSYVKKYLKSAVPAETRMRMTKFIQNWVAGLHGVATWHGAGSPQAQRLGIYRAVNLEEKKRLAESLAGIKKE